MEKSLFLNDRLSLLKTFIIIEKTLHAKIIMAFYLTRVKMKILIRTEINTSNFHSYIRTKSFTLNTFFFSTNASN
jgi:hypothetical protein